MATAISDAYAALVLDWTLGTTSTGFPGLPVWVGIGTGTSSGGSLTGELAGAYTRSSASFLNAANSSRSATNGADIDFGTFSTNVGSITHFGIFGSSTGTDIIYSSSLSVAKTVSSGDSLTFSTGTITVTIPAYGT